MAENLGPNIPPSLYYAMGVQYTENFGRDEQPYLYNGKEFVEVHGLNEYDSQARMYYATIMRTTTMDLFAENYYHSSPYAWCGNNPVNMVDPAGRNVFFAAENYNHFKIFTIMKDVIKGIILITAVVTVFVACNNNEPEASMQTCIMDEIGCSYYLTDGNRSFKNTFMRGEILVIWIDIKNQKQDTIRVNSKFLGRCYNKNNQWVEEMSNYIYNDTLTTYVAIPPGKTQSFMYGFYIEVPSGSYHYQNPHVSVYFNNQKDTEKEYVFPLTINFKVE